MLIGGRFVQGIGGAVASAVILAIIVTEFPEKAEQAKAMGMYAFVSAGGGSIGLLAGGALTQSLNWHWIFFVNVPIGVFAFVLGSALIEENEGIGLAGGVDVAGSVLITLATMLGAFAIVKSTEYGLLSARTLGVGGASLVLLGAFFWLESRISNPIMPLRILRLRMLMGSSLVRGLLITGMFSAFFLGALYLERVLGYDAIDTGLAFMPLTISIAALSMGLAVKAVNRFGPLNTLAAGLAAIAAGLLLLATQGVHASYFPGLFFAFLLLGLGAGASFLPLLTIGMADAPPQDAGLASGIINVSVQLFGAIGLATLGTIATDHTKALSASGHSLASALTGGYHLAYVVAARMRGARHPRRAAHPAPAREHGRAGGRGARARLRPRGRHRAGRGAARVSCGAGREAARPEPCMHGSAAGACAGGTTIHMWIVAGPHMCGPAGWRMRHPGQHLLLQACVSPGQHAQPGTAPEPGLYAFRRRSARLILPLAVFGSSSANSTMRGYL